jgi:hypothetical protein
MTNYSVTFHNAWLFWFQFRDNFILISSRRDGSSQVVSAVALSRCHCGSRRLLMPTVKRLQYLKHEVCIGCERDKTDEGRSFVTRQFAFIYAFISGHSWDCIAVPNLYSSCTLLSGQDRRIGNNATNVADTVDWTGRQPNGQTMARDSYVHARLCHVHLRAVHLSIFEALRNASSDMKAEASFHTAEYNRSSITFDARIRKQYLTHDAKSSLNS